MFGNDPNNKEVEIAKLPKSLLKVIKPRFNAVLMNKDKYVTDPLTRRSFLFFYNELLSPSMQQRFTNVESRPSPEEVVMIFIKGANKELNKSGDEITDISTIVHQQAYTFVEFLIDVITTEYEKRDALITRLRNYQKTLPGSEGIEDEDSLNTSNSNENGNGLLKTPTNSSFKPSLSSPPPNIQLKYPTPSFLISDMKFAQILGLIFNISDDTLQNDVNRVKNYATETKAEKDIKFLLDDLKNDKCDILWTPKDFQDDETYKNWKKKEEESLKSLIEKIKCLTSSSGINEEDEIGNGIDNDNDNANEEESFFYLPSKPKEYFSSLLVKCLKMDFQREQEENDGIELLLSKPSLDIMNECSKYWRIDYVSRATSLLDAADKSVLAINSSSSNENEDEDEDQDDYLDLQRMQDVFNLSRRIVIDQGKLKWDINQWPKADYELYGSFLLKCYIRIMEEIRKYLFQVYNSTKPKFGPLLSILGEYIESDEMFSVIEKVANKKKIFKKFQKTLKKAAELKYDEMIQLIPRDDSINSLNIIQMGESIVSETQKLTKRYPRPLLGEISVAKTSIQTHSMLFAADSQAMLIHMINSLKTKNQSLNIDEAIALYNTIYKIRDLHMQVTNNKPFGFNLENFFYPYIYEFTEYSIEKTKQFIEESLNKDTFTPLDIDQNVMYSSSVLDIFTAIRQTIKIVNDLDWENEYQQGKFYTNIIQGVSDGITIYAQSLMDGLSSDLGGNTKKHNFKSRQDKWIAGVKTVVNGKEKEVPEAYEFKTETCVRLNDISHTLAQLDKLEETLDPSSLSSIIDAKERGQKSKSSFIFNLKIVKAEDLKACDMNGLSDPYVRIIDTTTSKQIGKTRTIYEDLNPEWDETFEIPCTSSIVLTATVWDEDSLGTHDICGRTLIRLDPVAFRDGVPKDIWLDLDTQGRLLATITMESEKHDIQFYFGRAFRNLIRTEDRMIMAMVNKFSSFIQYALSLEFVKSVSDGNATNMEKVSRWFNTNVGNTTLQKPRVSEQEMKDAIIPLFDYLNANFSILAQYLTHELLIKVMARSWDYVTKAIDSLLLPPLTKKKSQQKPLTSLELEIVFVWLKSLCDDFFYNGGEGPPLETLRNNKYQELMVIPVYYDESSDVLKQEIERLQLQNEMLEQKQAAELREKAKSSTLNSNSLLQVNKIDQLITRKNTVMAHRNRKILAKQEQEIIDVQKLMPHTEDILLRILLLRNENDYVFNQLDIRERKAHRIATEEIVRAAARGPLRRK